MATSVPAPQSNPPNPQVPAAAPTPPPGRPPPTAVTNPPDPQVPAAAPTPPPGRPLLPITDDGGSFNRQIGDVRADGAVLTQFLSNGTPVFVIRPAVTTAPPVTPASNPQAPVAPTPATVAEAAAPPVNPTTNPQVTPNPRPPIVQSVTVGGQIQTIAVNGVRITNPTDFNNIATALRREREVEAKYANIKSSDPRFGDSIDESIAATNAVLAAGSAALNNVRAGATPPGGSPPPVTPAANPQVPPAATPATTPAVTTPAAVAVDPPDITGDESAFVPTPPTPAPAPVPTTPAAPAAPRVPAVTEPFPLPNDVDPNFITQPAVATIPSPGQADQDLANQTFANRENAKLQATIQAQRKQANDGDWRVKLRLAAGANYLYKATEPGILEPLSVSDGVVFPYTPKINTTYSATYSATDLTHSNYKGYFYQGSSVGDVKISATFTAQDTFEANYLLAVIHFFRSVTKMFYGQDQQYRGAPPPLVFLQGLGEYQFNLHPCVVSQFDYVLPDDVDYIRARSVSVNGTNLLQKRDRQTVSNGSDSTSAGRLQGAGLSAGGIFIPPPPPTLGIDKPTYVPTKMEMSITLLPIQTRAQLSQEFSLAKFANGNLVKGGYW
jgi:hypothetical protein